MLKKKRKKNAKTQYPAVFVYMRTMGFNMLCRYNISFFFFFILSARRRVISPLGFMMVMTIDNKRKGGEKKKLLIYRRRKNVIRIFNKSVEYRPLL